MFWINMLGILLLLLIFAIAVPWAIVYAIRSEPRIVTAVGKPMMRIEAEIRKYFSDNDFTVEMALDKVRKFRANDVYATLVDMLKHERLLGAEDPQQGYLYRLA